VTEQQTALPKQATR